MGKKRALPVRNEVFLFYILAECGFASNSASVYIASLSSAHHVITRQMKLCHFQLYCPINWSWIHLVALRLFLFWFMSDEKIKRNCSERLDLIEITYSPPQLPPAFFAKGNKRAQNITSKFRPNVSWQQTNNSGCKQNGFGWQAAGLFLAPDY